MSSFKKIAWSGSAVLLALVMALGLMPAQKASAAANTATVTGANFVVSNDSAFHTMSGPLTITEPAAGTWAAGDTVTLTHTGFTSEAAPGAAVTGSGACTVAYGANTTVFTIVAVTAGVDTCSLNVINMFQTVSGAPTSASVTVAGTVVGSVTSQRIVLGWATSTTCPTGATATPIQRTTPTFTSDPNQAGGGLCAYVADANGALLPSLPVTFSVSVGYVSTGTSKTTTALSSGAGIASTNYRGAGGLSTTDTAIASNSAINTVSTLPITLTAASGTTASKVAFLTPSVLAIAPNITLTAPGYSSPANGANVAVQVTDASGVGVAGQTMLVTVDRGALLANPAFTTVANTQAAINTACNGVTAKSLTLTSGTPGGSSTSVPTEVLSPGSTQTNAGAADFIVCANQNDSAGKITVTVQNVTTTMANGTLTLSQAGAPAKITATATGNAVNAMIADANGNPVADGTPVRFTMSANAGAVSTACTTTTNGQASSVVALIAASGTVIVSTDWNTTGGVNTAATCAAAGTQQLAASVGVPGGTATGGGNGGNTTGTGTAVSNTIPANGGFGFLVFGGGTVAQLVAASGCPVSTMALWVTSGGDFVTYIPGTTISAVNAAFLALWPNGIIPANTAFLGKCK